MLGVEVGLAAESRNGSGLKQEIIMAKKQVKYLLLLCGVSSWLVLFGCDSSALETGQFEAEVSGNDWRGRGYAEFSSQGELIIRASRWQAEDLEEILIGELSVRKGRFDVALLSQSGS